MKTKQTIVILFIFLSTVAFAQVREAIKPIAGSGRSFEDWFIEEEMKMERKQDTLAIPMMIVKPTSEFSTLLFKEKFPKENIPLESYVIEMPNLTNIVDTVMIVWFLKQHKKSIKGIVNISLAAITKQNQIVYYFDKNNNRSFTDDGLPFSFDNEIHKNNNNYYIETEHIDNEYYEVLITDKDYGKLTFQLANPNYTAKTETIASVETARATTDKHTGEVIIAENNIPKENKSYNAVYNNTIWNIAANKFTFNISLDLSSAYGKVEMQYEDLNTIPAKYIYSAHVASSAKIALGFDVAWKNFYIGLYSANEKMKFTDYSMTLISEKGSENFLSKGRWPNYFLHYGMYAGYNFRLNNYLRLSPYYLFVQTNIIGNTTFENESNVAAKDNFKNYKQNIAGLKLKFLLTDDILLFSNTSYSFVDFDARSCFSNIKNSSYKLDYKLFYLGFGIQYRLNKISL